MRLPPSDLHKQGFALLVVLLVLTLAGTLLVLAAQYSGQSALFAKETQEKLQQKWTLRSCESVLLPQTETFLANQEQETQEPVLQWTLSFQLNGQELELRFADEQAKVNANTFLAQHGPEALRPVAAELQQDCNSPLPIYLPADPHKIPAQNSSEKTYQTPEQFWQCEYPAQLIDQEGESQPVDQMTLWGDGKVHFRRASEPVLKEMTQDLLTGDEIQKLLDYRNSHPLEASADAALQTLAIPHERRLPLQQRLTDQSSCFSLWIRTRGITRNQYTLFVWKRGELRNSSVKGFRW